MAIMACGATHGVADRPLLVAFCGKGMEQTHTQLRGLGGEECVRNVSASALAGNLWIRYVVNLVQTHRNDMQQRIAMCVEISQSLFQAAATAHWLPAGPKRIPCIA